MLPTLLIILTLIIIISFIWFNSLLIKVKRRRIKNKPFPLHWDEIIEQNLPIYSFMPPILQKRLRDHVQVFLAEKQFIGCQGLTITDEIKITIAAQACLLLLNQGEEYYPKLVSILVYPSAFMVNRNTSVDTYVEEQRILALSGESWGRWGQIILSWDDVKRDTFNWQDGHNVVLHEFAHQLDQEDGVTDGVPILKSSLDYEIWGRVFRQEYQQLCQDLEQGRKTVIDDYGATNPAEFFAVVTETFFEKPQQMRKKHPLLYDVLKSYYQLDPLDFFSSRFSD